MCTREARRVHESRDVEEVGLRDERRIAGPAQDGEQPAHLAECAAGGVRDGGELASGIGVDVGQAVLRGGGLDADDGHAVGDDVVELLRDAVALLQLVLPGAQLRGGLPFGPQCGAVALQLTDDGTHDEDAGRDGPRDDHAVDRTCEPISAQQEDGGDRSECARRPRHERDEPQVAHRQQEHDEAVGQECGDWPRPGQVGCRACQERGREDRGDVAHESQQGPADRQQERRAVRQGDDHRVDDRHAVEARQHRPPHGDEHGCGEPGGDPGPPVEREERTGVGHGGGGSGAGRGAGRRRRGGVEVRCAGRTRMAGGGTCGRRGARCGGGTFRSGSDRHAGGARRGRDSCSGRGSRRGHG